MGRNLRIFIPIAFLPLVVILTVLISRHIHSPSALGPRTYYVAKTGSINGDGSLNQPWLTIAQAADIAQPGDTVVIRAGTYAEQLVPARSGLAGKEITYKNYSYDAVIIDASGFAQGVNIGSNSYLNIIGVRVLGAGESGFAIGGGASHISLINCQVLGAGWAGFDIGDGADTISIKDGYVEGTAVGAVYMVGDSPSTNITIDGLETYRTNSTYNMEAISLRKVQGFEIKNCRVHDTVARDRVGIDVARGSANGSIHHNVVYNVTLAGIYLDNHGGAQSNIGIYDNLVYDNLGAGIQLGDEVGSTDMTAVSIYNNVVYGNQRGFQIDHAGVETYSFALTNNTFYNNGSLTEIFVVPTHEFLDNSVIRNNIIVGRNHTVTLLSYPDSAGGGLTVDHNLFFDPDGYNESNYYGTGYLQADPLLANPPADFSLVSTSPAIDSGAAAGAPFRDYAGTSRPQGAGFDLGAFEFTPAATTQGSQPPNNPTPSPDQGPPGVNGINGIIGTK